MASLHNHVGRRSQFSFFVPVEILALCFFLHLLFTIRAFLGPRIRDVRHEIRISKLPTGLREGWKKGTETSIVKPRQREE